MTLNGDPSKLQRRGSIKPAVQKTVKESVNLVHIRLQGKYETAHSKTWRKGEAYLGKRKLRKVASRERLAEEK